MSKFPLLFFILLFGVVLFRTRRRFRRMPTPAERAIAYRMGMFSLVLAVFLLAAFLFLPNKHRLLALVPLSVGGLALARGWMAIQRRAADRAKLDARVESMKRARPL